MSEVRASTQVNNDSRFIEADGSVAFTANQSMGSNKLIDLADPTNPQEAATKSFVESFVQGLDVKEAVELATTSGTNLDLTNGNDATIDSDNVNRGDRILVKNQSTNTENGIYTADDLQVVIQGLQYDLTSGNDRNVAIEYVNNTTDSGTTVTSTTAGSGDQEHTIVVELGDTSGSVDVTASAVQTAISNDSTASSWVSTTVNDDTITQSVQGPTLMETTGYTRATDYDESSEITDGSFTFVERGTSNADSGWVQTETVDTIGTDAILFSQFSGAGQIQAGAGMTKSADTLNVNAADASMTINSDNLQVAIDSTAGTIKVGGSGLQVADATSGNILIGQGSGTDTAFQSVGGDATLSNTGSVTVQTPGTVIESTGSGVRLSQVSANQILVSQGTASDTTYQTVGGDVSMDSTGSFTVQTANATIDSTGTGIKVGDSTSGDILIAQGSGNDTTFNAITGDISLASTGAVTVQTSGSVIESTGSGIRLSQTTSGDILIAQGTTSDTLYQTVGGDATLAADGTLTLDSTVVFESDVIVREAFTGDGSTTTFTLANSPVTGTERVYLNGLLQHEANPDDYNITGSDITFTTAPANGDPIRVTYLIS